MIKKSINLILIMILFLFQRTCEIKDNSSDITNTTTNNITNTTDTITNTTIDNTTNTTGTITNTTADNTTNTTIDDMTNTTIDNKTEISENSEASQFRNEICSYNGIPHYVKFENGSEQVTCECDSSYHNDPDKKEYIRGQIVQCSYVKKQKIVAFFLSLAFPFGFDHLYLGYIFHFLITCIFGIFSIVNYVVWFCNFNQFQEESDENKKELYDKSYTKKEKKKKFTKEGSKINDSKKENKNKNKTFQIYRSISFILIILFFFYWIGNTIYRGVANYKDDRGVEVDNDMKFLFGIDDDDDD